MKKISFIICILLALSLTGCAMAQKADSAPVTIAPLYEEAAPTEQAPPLPTGFEIPPTPQPETTPIQTEPPAQEVAPPPVSEGQDGAVAMISTKYFDIALPEAWSTGSCYQTRDTANGGYTVRIYESQSYQQLGSGELCTLMLTPTDDESYKALPAYELLAALDTPEGSFYLIVVPAATPRLAEGAEDTYNAMAAQLMDVLYTVQPKEGIEMAMP